MFEKEPIVFGIIGCWDKKYDENQNIPNIWATKQIKDRTSGLDVWIYNRVGTSGSLGNLSQINADDGYGGITITGNKAEWYWKGRYDSAEEQLNYKDNIYYWFAMF